MVILIRNKILKTLENSNDKQHYLLDTNKITAKLDRKNRKIALIKCKNGKRLQIKELKLFFNQGLSKTERKHKIAYIFRER